MQWLYSFNKVAYDADWTAEEPAAVETNHRETCTVQEALQFLAIEMFVASLLCG